MSSGETVLLPCASAADLDRAVRAAVSVLQSGGVVAVPAETVYGLAADALNPVAAARIFEAKERPFFDPLICHMPEAGWVEELTQLDDGQRDMVRCLGDRFWPGPVTLVLPRRACVPDLVCAGLETVAIRMPAHPVFRAVLNAFGKPLAAPSANRFGRISPTAAEHVREELGGRIPLILDGGSTPLGLESTILRVEQTGVRILRSGPVTREDLAAVVHVLEDTSAAEDGDRPEAPGRLLSHYAPRTPLRLGAADSVSFPVRARLGLLAWGNSEPGYGAAEVLCPTGDLSEAASRLFGAMRRLDHGGWEGIVAELAPEKGLGVAINDRLRRAAARA
jgi:L-threonylcarbamoyladenylate synthase